MLDVQILIINNRSIELLINANSHIVQLKNE